MEADLAVIGEKNVKKLPTGEVSEAERTVFVPSTIF